MPLTPIARPDLNGARIKNQSLGDTIWLIDEGLRRAIPNPETYDNLFRAWNRVNQYFDVSLISRGSDISSGAWLGKAPPADGIYLVSNGVKRGILNPQVMERYYFTWDRVRLVSQSELDRYPNASMLTESGPLRGGTFQLGMGRKVSPSGSIYYENRISLTGPTGPTGYDPQATILWVKNVTGRNTSISLSLRDYNNASVGPVAIDDGETVDSFRNYRFAGTYTAQYIGGSTSAPPSVTIAMEWRKP